MTLHALEAARRLAPRLAARAAGHDRDGSFPVEDFHDLREAGLFGLMVPRELGGSGATFAEYAAVATELARGNGATALVFNMHASVTGALGAVTEELADALGVPDEALAARDRLKDLDTRIEAALDRHPDAALVRSLPGMGATLSAEFLAEAGGITRFPTPDQLASAAGLAPVLKQSGKVRYLQRATAGNKALKRVFYQSAFCAIQHDPASRAFYARKRREGKRHHQALVALARRRIGVLWAMLHSRQAFQPHHTRAA
jgi:hypothetical protein